MPNVLVDVTLEVTLLHLSGKDPSTPSFIRTPPHICNDGKPILNDCSIDIELPIRTEIT